MITDAENQLTGASPQTDVRNTGTYWSENAIDLGTPGTPPQSNALAPDLGKGNPLEILVKVIQAFASAGAATLTIDLCNDDNWDDTTGMSSPTVVWTSGAIPVASLVAGYEALIRYLPTGITQQYLALRFVVATANMSAGSLVGEIVAARQTNRYGN
jgi:hypothetical protein